MISTISTQIQYTGMQDRMLSLTANAAGDPLPLIPRRPQPHLVQSPSWRLTESPLSSPTLSAAPSLAPSCGRNEPSISPSASIVTITPATPPKTESESDSSPLRRRKRRKRVVHVPNPAALYPPELSTQMPSRRTPASPPPDSTWWPISKNSSGENAAPQAPTGGTPLVYTPGMTTDSPRETSNQDVSPGHSFQSLRPSWSVSESLSSSSSLSSISSASTANQTSTPLIRKKSGQVVRPSLKSSSSYSISRSISNLGSMSPDLSFPSSKSEPPTPFSVATPTISKAVHFDKNLEQVKLFLTEQKPLAVSREGSPEYTDEGETSASGAENNEITRFFGSIFLLGDPTKKSTTKLLMHANIPSRSLVLPPSITDVTLESLSLAKGDKSIQGAVLVRNIAFDKSVTARFSFDGWCTRSEVNARWKEGAGPTRDGRTEWDRFEFVIWLGDLKLGEEKGNPRKLELAVRYRVASRGYELWDNNGGRNYVATFERPGLLEDKERGRKARLKKKVPPVPFSVSDLLGTVATSKTTRKSRSTSPTPMTAMSTHHSASTSPFSTKPHTRTRSFPFTASSSSESMQSAFGWPPSPLVPAWTITSPSRAVPPASPTTLGSPRDLGDDAFHSNFKFPTLFGNDPEEGVDDSGPEGGEMRRHQRGCYFDFSAEPLNLQEATISGKYVRSSAGPATPLPPSSRYRSFPSLGLTFRDSTGPREDQQSLVQMEGLDSSYISIQSSASFVDHDTLSAPSPTAKAGFALHNADDTSDSSSNSTLLDNESPPSSRSSTPPLEDEADIEHSVDQTTDSDDRELYKDFLNRFCFFTGPGSPPASLSNTRLDEVMNMMMKNESSSESSTPTITPSGSILDPSD